MDFFIGMSALQQAFWWVAIIASLIFLIQLIFTIVGTDFTDGLHADFNGDLMPFMGHSNYSRSGI
jgi:uncharacterized membrane protein